MTRLGWRIAGGLAAGTGTLLAGLGLMVTAAYLIARAAERPPILDLMLLFVAIRFFGLTRPALRYVERLLSHDAMFRVLTRVRMWFMSALLPLSPGQLAGYRAGDLLSRLAADVDALQESYLRVLAPATVAVLVSTIAIAGFAIVDPRIALVVLAALVSYGAGWSWLAFHQSRDIGERRNTVRRTFSAELVGMLQGADDILACGYEDRALQRLAALQQQSNRLERRDGRTLGLQAAAAIVFVMGTAWVVLALSLQAAAAETMSPLWIAPLMLAAVVAFESVEGLPAAWLYAAQTRDSARRVLAVARTRPAVVETDQPVQLPRTAPRVHVDRITFRYPDAPPVLERLSLHVSPGEHVAIAGATGAGKSTLLSLLMRNWDPQHGRISIGGVDLRLLGLEAFRAQVAVLPQEVHVFNETLRDNVRLARRAARDAEVCDALRRAGLDAFLAAAAHGLDTRLGEHGARMSAGERQRLSLARALLTDATLVLADEPTAHLDADTERAFLAELSRWARHRTLIVASHRPAVLAVADRVFTLADGTLVHHAEVLRSVSTTRQ
jgi:thiol reductant ABC exporter CydC subunit